jgi:hypothetical protein
VSSCRQETTYDLEDPGGAATSEPFPAIVFLFLPALL